MPPRTPHAIHEGDVGIHAYAGAGAGLGGELKTVPEDFIVTELLQDGREVMLEDPDGAGEDAAANEEEDEWEARCTSGSDRIFTFCFFSV